MANGGKRSKIEGYNLKLQGLSKGAPDLVVFYPSSGYHGFFIEFKFGKNKLTIEQEEKIKLLRAQNYKCQVCWSWEEAKTVFLEYLKNDNKI